ncbi:MAG: zf-HC2 domain-containing protein [Phycisphaerae bacterium]|jgi:hypothetical protein
MITCQHARQLFDRYLDGELSASLQTELHAHRLSCSACQNELALVEACGDVIAMDFREPRVSLSFTDRVILAQRGRRPAPPRRWGRLVLYVGSPMAAAASVAFAVFMMMPPAPARLRPPEVRAEKVAAPEAYQFSERNQSPEALQDLKQTPQMDARSFADSMFAPFVERSKNTLEGTSRVVEEFRLLMQSGISRTNDNLIARWRAREQGRAASELPGLNANPLDPALPDPLPQPDPAPSPRSDEQLEPL